MRDEPHLGGPALGARSRNFEGCASMRPVYAWPSRCRISAYADALGLTTCPIREAGSLWVRRKVALDQAIPVPYDTPAGIARPVACPEREVIRADGEGYASKRRSREVGIRRSSGREQ
jgi:hypothetical protein